MQKVYNYHQITKEFISETAAKESPLEPDIFLVPANATTIDPPLAGDKEVAVFTDGTWLLQPNWRGVDLWDKSTCQKVESITKIGVSPVSTVIDQAPPDDLSIWDDDLGWKPDLSKLKGKIITDLKVACDANCRGGLESSQLGTPHTYETTTDRDQANLNALTSAALKNMATAGWTQNMTCIDAAGIKARRSHTAAQLAEVGEGAQLMISGNIDKFWNLLADLETAYLAGNQTAMLAVIW
ncbi:MAG: hypothetical protein KKD73_01590 [Proteobacteria bacterium]|nr:hypothetical protein [Pseudomonadota bacterium]MBU1640063.1 hypothetical protein [Pseudomonadota bacterium]